MGARLHNTRIPGAANTKGHGSVICTGRENRSSAIHREGDGRIQRTAGSELCTAKEGEAAADIINRAGDVRIRSGGAVRIGTQIKSAWHVQCPPKVMSIAVQRDGPGYG